MLTTAEIQEARDFLGKAENPVFLFDDDCDGLCSYLLLKRYCKNRGRGIPLKASPAVDPVVLSKVQEYQPDLLVILDRPSLSQEFIDLFQVPILWFDHHPLVQRRNVHYFNPLKHDARDNRPTTALAYAVTEQDLWIATVGCVADWYVPEFLSRFKEEYPGIITNGADPGEIMFATPLGMLIKIFYFMLKGKTTDVRKNMQALEKVQDPDELLKETTEEGKFLVRRTKAVLKEYQEIIEKAKKRVTKERVFVFLYPASKNSFTSFLANELSYIYPEKLIIVGRERGGEVRMSLRNKDLHIPQLLDKALVNVKGRGGGHDHACGSTVAQEDFDRFIQNIKNELAVT